MSDIYVEDTRSLEEIAEEKGYKLTKKLMIEYIREMHVIQNAEYIFETGRLLFKNNFLPPTESTLMHYSYTDLRDIVICITAASPGHDFETYLEMRKVFKELNIHPMCRACLKSITRNGVCPNRCMNHTEYCREFKGVTL